MKSAKTRAMELWEALPPSAQVAIDLNYLRDKRGLTGLRAWLRDVEASLKEHASNQRHLCAEAVADAVTAGSSYLAGERCQVAAMNAPAPGEKQ